MFDMNRKRDHFLNEIDELIKETDTALAERKTGIAGDGTIDELEDFIQTLKEMKDEVSKNKLPPKAKREPTMGWYVTDTWSYQNPLGAKIIRIEEKYKKL
ncbi:MAG: hypothetical protein OEW48_14445 [Phycisphaerae bacterium]|nr:hypothetical protein [Phycisphaerae bacterium]